MLVKNNFYGDALHDFDVISTGVFRGQNAEPRTCSGLKTFDLAAKNRVQISVNVNVNNLSDLYFFDLRFLEIGNHPNSALRNRHQGLVGLHQLTFLNGAARDKTVLRRENFRVAEFEFGLIVSGLRLFNLRFRNTLKQLDNPLKIREGRREMARLLTVLNEKQRSSQSAAKTA